VGTSYYKSLQEQLNTKMNNFNNVVICSEPVSFHSAVSQPCAAAAAAAAAAFIYLLSIIKTMKMNSAL